MPRPLGFWTGVLSLLSAVLVPVTAVGQSAPAAKTLSDTLALNRTGTVEIKNKTGSITVTTWDRALVGYKVTLVPPEEDSMVVSTPDVDHSEEEISLGHEDSWTLRIPGLLTISPSGTDDPIAHYHVTMPRTADLEVDDHQSTINVSNLNAELDIATFQGEVSVNSVTGTLDVSTHSGTITANAIRGGGTLDTHSGSIAVSFEELSTSTSAETHSGTIRFFLPSDAGFELRTDLASAELLVDEAFGPPSEKEERRRFNGGGPELFIDAFSGQVEIRPLGARSPSSP